MASSAVSGDGVGRPRGFPLRGVEAGEREQPVPGFFEAISHRLALQPPFPEERFAARLDLGLGLGIDHVAVVLGQLVVQGLGRVGEQVAVLVDRAALDRRIRPQLGQCSLEAGSAIDDDERRRLQAPGIEIVEERPPSGLALAAHIPDRQQDLLPVPTHTDRPRAPRSRWLSGRAASSPPCRRESRRTMSSSAKPRAAPSLPVGLHLAPGPAH